MTHLRPEADIEHACRGDLFIAGCYLYEVRVGKGCQHIDLQLEEVCDSLRLSMQGGGALSALDIRCTQNQARSVSLEETALSLIV